MADSVGTSWGWGAWAWLVVPLAVYGLVSLTLFAFGRTDETNPLKFFFGQISDTLERITGYPGWSMAGALSGLMMLLVAFIGFYWDVAWHIDNGRDDQLFTPSHVMILVGLGGLIYAAGIAVLFASIDKADVGLRAGPLRIPWSAVLLTALGVGGVVAFPLDALWHNAYGVDVTLWSPSHIQLVAGGSLATIAVWIMATEGRRSATEPMLLGRAIHVLTAGTVLVGMSTLQAEFDFGVPQFQALYLPVILMIAAGFTLVAARVALGRWGAVKVTFVYLVLRAFVAVAVGGALNHTVPRFPLYLGSALLVEAVAWRLGTDRPLRLALSAGALVGTVGLVAELGWLALWGGVATALPLGFLGKIALLAPVAAVAAALLGAGFGAAVASARQRLPLGALAAAGAVLIVALAFPFPRRVGQVTATVRLRPAGAMADVEVVLDPPTAARGATVFAVTASQGGSPMVRSALYQVGPGRYASARPVPVTGKWKTSVALQRGDEMMAVPVYLPADPRIGAPAVPAVPERTERFVRNTTLLMREVHPGPAWPAMAAYAGLALLVSAWIALIAVAARRLPPAPVEPPTWPADRSSPPAPAMVVPAG